MPLVIDRSPNGAVKTVMYSMLRPLQVVGYSLYNTTNVQP
jgi:hypothetical protein